MAILRIPDETRTITSEAEVRDHLSSIGIDFERWKPSRKLADDATDSDILEAYSGEIDKLKAQGGYVTADVINVNRDTPNLDVMLAKFSREHWHADDEVRFIIEGRGIFHINAGDGPVAAIEVEAGDLIRVPAGTRHWFDLCADKRIRAIRLFKDPSGWAPNYTESGIDSDYQPICLGPSYIAHT